ncbi:hypothetical protein [Dyadobacter sp. CY343]|uniref:hypothetical protein n=1 Tax=Dyadobacter sp. CY343 TaxID=2907299 RepID=UPI001F3BC499|nr:hypothetical protein [Dyadobacter sp. CY343]MCE7062361.1 hypothetical protein [Dyadobacter sp. CY343]
MTDKAYYIVLEGLDGTGKTTLFNNLVTLFKENGIPLQTLCPTRIVNPESLAEKIYRSNIRFKKNTISRMLIFAYRSYLSSNRISWGSSLILGDRSIIVSYIKNWRKWLHSRFLTVLLVNTIEPFIRAPDVVLLLSAPDDVIMHRISQKEIIEIDESLESLLAMKSAYNELRNTYKIPRLKKTIWIDIDSNKSSEALASEVYDMLRSKFLNSKI